VLLQLLSFEGILASKVPGFELSLMISTSSGSALDEASSPVFGEKWRGQFSQKLSSYAAPDGGFHSCSHPDFCE
jgi:hypothetical protein